MGDGLTIEFEQGKTRLLITLYRPPRQESGDYWIRASRPTGADPTRATSAIQLQAKARACLLRGFELPERGCFLLKRLDREQMRTLFMMPDQIVDQRAQRKADSFVKKF